MVITKKEFDYIKGRNEGERFVLKVDFGLREVKVVREKKEAILGDEVVLNLNEKIKGNFCYHLDKQKVEVIAFFSRQTNRFYKLIPTSDWPSIAISSVPMHRLYSPRKDTQNKIDFLKPHGYILDTCMGAGYTAIMASGNAKKVVTFENDENVVFLAEINPLSGKLFSSPNINVVKEDVSLAVKTVKNDYFDCIIHDPPTFKLAPQLYSLSFYQQLLRILKLGGKMFHYTPLYKIKRGVDFPSRIKRKLKVAGFRIIKYSQDAGGFLCRK